MAREIKFQANGSGDREAPLETDVLCVMWGPSPAVSLSWRGGGGVGFSDSGVTGSGVGGRRGPGRTGGKEEAAFLGGGDKAPLRAGVGGTA